MDRLTEKLYIDGKLDSYHLRNIITCSDYEKANHSGYLTIMLTKANDKLGKLEDIMEKHGIDSVEELDFRLSMKQNDDTWKKVCELMEDYVNNCEKYGCGNECNFVIDVKDFYTQAQKEGKL